MTKHTIGRLDRADFPELGISGVKVKVDTGAFTSSLYATDIKERMLRGHKHLYFKAFGPEHPSYTGKALRFADFSMKQVKNSGGEVENRYFIESVIHLFGKDFPIHLSLTNRSKMRTPVLLGRKLLRNGFTVDITQQNLSLRQSRKNSKS